MPYQWPGPLDERQQLLQTVGSFWSDTYQGNDLVESLLYARARLSEQAHTNLLELVQSLSRHKVPRRHSDLWRPFVLKVSEQLSGGIPKFDGVYDFTSGLFFDQPANTPLYVWAIENPPTDIPVILNGITGNTVTLVRGIDFFLQDGAIWFRENPFDNSAILQEDIYENGEIVDRSCTLWLHRAEQDLSSVFIQYGYAVGINNNPSPRYRDLVNAVYDGLVEGTSVRCVKEFLAACCDVPLAKADETVTTTFDDSRKRWTITPEHSYGSSLNTTLTAAAGDAVYSGDTLSTALQFFEFNRGQVPYQIKALTVGRGLLAVGFMQELLFENKDVDLIVDTSGDYTKVSFELGGHPADVEKFWDDIHAAGVAEGQTLAMLLDTRPESAKDTKPGPLALPRQVNPFGFLTANLFRNNLIVAKCDPHEFGPEALGLTYLRHLRKLIPPHTAMIVVVELSITGDEVILDGPGDETRAGYEETVQRYDANSTEDEIDPEDMLEESVRVLTIGGQCR